MNTLRRYLAREVAQATGFVLLALMSLFSERSVSGVVP
jgi:lipopolysaccharide export LptBFGC system permease protein LptF